MQNQLDNRVYAGFFVRLVAYGIDSLLAMIAASIVKMPLSLMAMAGVSALKANFIFQYSVLDVLGYVGVAAYFVLLTYFTHSTPGKMLMRLEVVTASGEWTFLNVLYRETVGRFLSSLLCIGYLAVMVQEKKQGFHDMLCDTYVVYRNMIPESERKDVQPVMPDEPSEMVSAFEMTESHPIDTMKTTQPETPTAGSFDGLNPDSSNLYNNDTTE